MESRKLIPYSVYLPPEYYAKIKQAAQHRQASSLVRDAIVMMLDGGDVYKSGYNININVTATSHMASSFQIYCLLKAPAATCLCQA